MSFNRETLNHALIARKQKPISLTQTQNFQNRSISSSQFHIPPYWSLGHYRDEEALARQVLVMHDC